MSRSRRDGSGGSGGDWRTMFSRIEEQLQTTCANPRPRTMSGVGQASSSSPPAAMAAKSSSTEHLGDDKNTSPRSNLSFFDARTPHQAESRREEAEGDFTEELKTARGFRKDDPHPADSSTTSRDGALDRPAAAASLSAPPSSRGPAEVPSPSALAAAATAAVSPATSSPQRVTTTTRLGGGGVQRTASSGALADDDRGPATAEMRAFPSAPVVGGSQALLSSAPPRDLSASGSVPSPLHLQEASLLLRSAASTDDVTRSSYGAVGHR